MPLRKQVGYTPRRLPWTWIMLSAIKSQQWHKVTTQAKLGDTKRILKKEMCRLMTTWTNGRSLEQSTWTSGCPKSGNVTTTTTTRPVRGHVHRTRQTLYYFTYTSRILRDILAFIPGFVPKSFNTPPPLCPCIYCSAIVLHFIVCLNVFIVS